MKDGMLVCHPGAGSGPVRESSPGVAGTRGTPCKGTPLSCNHHVSSGIGIPVPAEETPSPAIKTSLNYAYFPILAVISDREIGFSENRTNGVG